MKLTELKIARKHSWSEASATNPLICTVKLSSDHATVETVLSDDDMHAMIKLVQRLVADAAARNVASFCDDVTAIEAGESRDLLAAPGGV